jgi:hypothetical protein
MLVMHCNTTKLELRSALIRFWFDASELSFQPILLVMLLEVRSVVGSQAGNMIEWVVLQCHSG